MTGLLYNGTPYYFQKNIQGDIVRICNVSGNTVVEYTYDAWGKVLSVTGSMASTLGQDNPFRYRGYYYDTETGFYYLQTRYYDPEIGRFLNADAFIGANGDIAGYNSFAYCSNNPIISKDLLGNAAVTCLNDDSIHGSPWSGAGGGGGIAKAVIAVVTVVVIANIKGNVDHAMMAAVTEIKEKVIFPVNPNAFNPVGLIKVFRTGTMNGNFISWMNPLTNTEVFRWDENPNHSNGSHYHIYGTGHYYPGMVVPEPYATIYFTIR